MSSAAVVIGALRVKKQSYHNAKFMFSLAKALDMTFFFLNQNVLIFFLFLQENICCGYLLEVRHF